MFSIQKVDCFLFDASAQSYLFILLMFYKLYTEYKVARWKINVYEETEKVQTQHKIHWNLFSFHFSFTMFKEMQSLI